MILMALCTVATGIKIKNLDLAKYCTQMAHSMKDNGVQINGMVKACMSIKMVTSSKETLGMVSKTDKEKSFTLMEKFVRALGRMTL